MVKKEIADKPKCAYCGQELKGDFITFGNSKFTKQVCNSRHLYNYMVDIYTRGRQYEEGLEEKEA